jgi:hypothetical protein
MYFKFKELTCKFRLKPAYLIIGTQKGGTTSLYNYLIRHPQIQPALNKEIHYFDLHFNEPLSWYLAHYPLDVHQRIFSSIGEPLISGEATPYYLFHPLASQRVAQVFPNMKLICMLRNPIDRAYSHFNHNRRKGRENRTFEEAINIELKNVPLETEKLLKNGNAISNEHRHFSYLFRGIYVDQLKNWHKYFMKENLLIIKSEDFFDKTNMIMDTVFKFLGINQFQHFPYKAFNKQTYESKINKNTREALTAFFRFHNERLYEYLGVDYGWR